MLNVKTIQVGIFIKFYNFQNSNILSQIKLQKLASDLNVDKNKHTNLIKLIWQLFFLKKHAEMIVKESTAFVCGVLGPSFVEFLNSNVYLLTSRK